jgi:SAM-dependent methyltransferase
MSEGAAYETPGSDKVREVWSENAGTWGGRGLHWLEHAAVQRRIKRLVTGDENLDFAAYFIEMYFADRMPVDRVLVLGCGPGEFERGLTQYGFAREYDAIDIADGAIEKAKKAAADLGLSNIHYRRADLNKIVLPAGHYDVIFGISSVHHISALEHLYEQVCRALKRDGYFYLEEYIGASQFQWPDRQVEYINTTLATLPEDLRRSLTNPAELKCPVARPTIEFMNNGDPSEAVRSAEIIPLLHKYFESVSVKGYGGGLLQMLMEDITANFREDDPEAKRWLDRIFKIEDDLIANGEVPHDFAVIVAQKPSGMGLVKAWYKRRFLNR